MVGLYNVHGLEINWSKLNHETITFCDHFGTMLV